MPAKSNKNDFVAKAIAIHGDKYGYDSVVYINNTTSVDILCPIHGKFQQTPHAHLEGHGCPRCGIDKNIKLRVWKEVKTLKSVLFGECYNDSQESLRGEVRKAYIHWRNMLVRCYNQEYHQKKPSYAGCSVCDEWKYFSNFLKWFRDPENRYVSGHCLDKDILVKCNKLYSPETCCFVPKSVNSLLLNRKRERGLLPMGVKPRGHKFYAEISIRGKIVYLGLFSTKEDAFEAYKKERESYIKERATEYYSKGLITEKVYNALLNYKIEITD